MDGLNLRQTGIAEREEREVENPDSFFGVSFSLKLWVEEWTLPEWASESLLVSCLDYGMHEANRILSSWKATQLEKGIENMPSEFFPHYRCGVEALAMYMLTTKKPAVLLTGAVPEEVDLEHHSPEAYLSLGKKNLEKISFGQEAAPLARLL